MVPRSFVWWIRAPRSRLQRRICRGYRGLVLRSLWGRRLERRSGGGVRRALDDTSLRSGSPCAGRRVWFCGGDRRELVTVADWGRLCKCIIYLSQLNYEHTLGIFQLKRSGTIGVLIPPEQASIQLCIVALGIWRFSHQNSSFRSNSFIIN